MNDDDPRGVHSDPAKCNLHQALNGYSVEPRTKGEVDGPGGEGGATGVAPLVREACDTNLAHPMLTKKNSGLFRKRVADLLGAGKVRSIARHDEGGLFQLDRCDESLVRLRRRGRLLSGLHRS